MPLTDSAVRTAKPREKLYRLSDTLGLSLEVTPTSSKLWRFRYRFAGKANPGRPLSENTVNKALRNLGYEGRQTGHGFRHLLSTELNNRGYNRDWIERQLAHGDENEIRDTYNHAHYLDQRRQMMQAWANEIDALCTGGKVVGIRRTA